MREELCPECQGNGYVEYIAGSYFSEPFGNYLPLEDVAPCRTCSGTGYVEVWDESEASAEEDRAA